LPDDRDGFELSDKLPLYVLGRADAVDGLPGSSLEVGLKSCRLLASE